MKIMDGCCGTEGLPAGEAGACACKENQHGWGWFFSAIVLAAAVGLMMVVFSSRVEAAERLKEIGPGIKLPIVILGMTIRRWASYLALLFFVLNFATCYAMPWARKYAPWSGEQPGVDQKDTIGHFPFTHWHAYFAWLAIFFLGLHGVLGFACAWFGVCL